MEFPLLVIIQFQIRILLTNIKIGIRKIPLQILSLMTLNQGITNTAAAALVEFHIKETYRKGKRIYIIFWILKINPKLFIIAKNSISLRRTANLFINLSSAIEKNLWAITNMKPTIILAINMKMKYLRTNGYKCW